jgi:hypothetical protein
LASPKQAKRVTEVIDLTRDDGNHTEVSYLRYTQTAQHRVTLTSTLLNRPHPGRLTKSLYPPPSSPPKSPAHTADGLLTSSTAATPGKKKHPFINIPRWSPLHRRLQQRSDKLLDNLSVDVLHTGTDSSRSSSTKLGPTLKNFKAFITKQPENSPEIPETSIKRMWGEEDDHSDGNTPSHACGRWSTATDRTQVRSITERVPKL